MKPTSLDARGVLSAAAGGVEGADDVGDGVADDGAALPALFGVLAGTDCDAAEDTAAAAAVDGDGCCWANADGGGDVSSAAP